MKCIRASGPNIFAAYFVRESEVEAELDRLYFFYENRRNKTPYELVVERC